MSKLIEISMSDDLVFRVHPEIDFKIEKSAKEVADILITDHRNKSYVRPDERYIGDLSVVNEEDAKRKVAEFLYNSLSDVNRKHLLVRADRLNDEPVENPVEGCIANIDILVGLKLPLSGVS